MYMDDATHMRAPHVHGTIVRQQVAGGFSLIEASYAPHDRVEPHEHEHPSITLVVEGSYRERLGNREEVLTRSSVLIRPGGMRHGNELDARGARGFFVIPTHAHADALGPSRRVLEDVAHFREARLANLGRRIRARFWSGVNGSNGLAVEEAVVELIAVANREPAPRMTLAPAWLGEVRERLVAEFVKPPALTGMALAVGVHASYLGRAFRRRYGITPGQFVHHLRIEWAADALVRTDKPLCQIAYETGFADQSHFGRIFRRLIGVSPAAYRRLSRTNVEPALERMSA